MNKLETSITIVLQQLKPKLAAATWESKRTYYNRMLRLANVMGIKEACKKLYDAYVADDAGSKQRRRIHTQCVRLLDAVAGTNARDKYGKLYNEQSLPSKAETREYFQNRQFPVANGVSLAHLIVKAEIEMQYLKLTESTIGQYKNAWIKIRQYFCKHNSVNYEEQLLQRFIREIGVCRSNGTMKEWKWKINRKAAHVLVEVASTGQFRWGLIKPDIKCSDMEIELIRNHYLSSLKYRNLSKSTIYLHDYVFRKLITFLETKAKNNLFLLSPKNIHCVTINFAGICNKRSMATILPILRLILIFLHVSGYVEKDLSGIVMNGFIHRGRVASYISKESQALLVKQINHESKRTKAIILLAMKLGLRGSDIVNLTFSEVDWHNDKIRLNQKKTGEPLVLPLLPDVGNALMEYIQHERPKRDDKYPYIFLRKEAPYNKIASTYLICSKLLMKLGIKPVNGQSIGIHVFRYTIVHRLLAAKVPHQVITDTLGHVSKESDKPYLSMEDSMLKLCALDLSVVGKISWKGGA